jgi:hypothetical protein
MVLDQNMRSEANKMVLLCIGPNQGLIVSSGKCLTFPILLLVIVTTFFWAMVVLKATLVSEKIGQVTVRSM